MTLSSVDLSYMRDSLEELMPDTCSILTATIVSDGQGGMIQTWGTVSAGVKCRLDPGRKQAFEAVQGAALQPFDYWMLTLPHGTTITTEQRVVVGVQTFNVEAVDDGKSWQASVRCTVKKV